MPVFPVPWGAPGPGNSLPRGWQRGARLPIMEMMKSARTWLGVLVLAVALAGPVSASTHAPFDPGLAGFRVLLDGEECPFNVLAFYVRPEESMPIEIESPDPVHSYALLADRGTVIELG